MSEVKIKWDNGSWTEYSKSMDALQEYDIPPEIKGAISIKGEFSRVLVDRIVAVASEFGVEVGLSLTAKWPKDGEPQNLRLFPPEAH